MTYVRTNRLFKILAPLVILSLIIFVRPTITHAAIGVGTEVRGADFGGNSSMTWTGPTVSGSKTVGVVSCGVSNGSIPSGVTWGGKSMTEVTGAFGKNIVSAAGGLTIKSYFIVAPSSAASVVLTSTGTWTAAFCDANYFTGVDQASPVDLTAATSTGASSSSFSGTLVTSGANEYVVDNIVEGSSGTLTATAPSVAASSGNNGTFSWASSYQGVIASPGTVTMAWTSTVTSTWGQGIIALKPFVPATSTLIVDKSFVVRGQFVVK